MWNFEQALLEQEQEKDERTKNANHNQKEEEEEEDKDGPHHGDDGGEPRGVDHSHRGNRRTGPQEGIIISTPATTTFVHEALVRERTENVLGFDDLYEVIDEIGRGGLCTVYKIQKRPDQVGGSARRSLMVASTSSSSLLSLRGRRRRRSRAVSTSMSLSSLFTPPPPPVPVLSNVRAASAGEVTATTTTTTTAQVSASPLPPSPTTSTSGVPRPVSPAATNPLRRAISRDSLSRLGSLSEHGGGSLSAPGTPTRTTSNDAATQQQQQQQQVTTTTTTQQPPRRRNKNVRSLSSPSTLAERSPFWQRAESNVSSATNAHDPRQETSHHQQRRLDVRALRSAFKRGGHRETGGARAQGAGGGDGDGTPEVLYAVKVFNLKLLTPAQARQLKNEVEALKTLDHPSIIKAYETFTSRESRQLLLVMELCTGGDLYARIPYAERDVARVLYQVLSALIYMHDRNIVHRDLKLENIMFESPHPDAAVKLIDFGLAARIGASSSSSGTMLSSSIGNANATGTGGGGSNSSVLKERVGTLYCMAPCVLLGQGYSSKAGMWSVGVITYTMLSGGTHPFHGKTPKQVVARILQNDYSFENDIDDAQAWASVSDEAKSFINALLKLEPSDRLSARQAMKHPWIQRQSVSAWNDSVSQFWNPEKKEEEVTSSDDVGSPEALAAATHAVSSRSEWRHRVTSEMVRYAEWSDFRKLALNVVAKRSTSDEIFEIRQVFAEFDINNSGTITLDDFRSALTQYDPTYSDEELEDIFRKIDVGGTSVINYTEFLASALEARGSIEEWRLAEAFDMLDHDGTGYITKADLRRVVGNRGSGGGVASEDESYLDELIAQAGGSTVDGKISYPEFLRALSEQTHDMVYGMYEASRSSKSYYLNRGTSSSDATASSAGTDSILERRGIAIPRLVSVTARQRLMAGRKRLASSAKSRIADLVQVLTPTSKDDVRTYITTGRPNLR